ncbi:hypothetical protein Q7P37_011575 [Cladosporium fusiforme]
MATWTLAWADAHIKVYAPFCSTAFARPCHGAQLAAAPADCLPSGVTAARRRVPEESVRQQHVFGVEPPEVCTQARDADSAVLSSSSCTNLPGAGQGTVSSEKSLTNTLGRQHGPAWNFAPHEELAKHGATQSFTRRIDRNNIQADHHRVADILLSHFFHCKFPSFTLGAAAPSPQKCSVQIQSPEAAFLDLTINTSTSHIFTHRSKRVAATHPPYHYCPEALTPSSAGCNATPAVMSETNPNNALVDAQAPAAENEPQTNKPEGEAPIAKEDEETAGKPATTEATAPDGEQPAEVAEGPSEPAADAPTTNGKDNKKRKSTGGVPEHKGKKLNKKKSMPNLQLDCKPGDYYWARLKGYPPWPAIICAEDMLPEQLLASRPVSTTRADGSLRDDFKEGGKNAKERTFPVMFLSTNEFTWLVNTGLSPLDPEECKSKPNTKMTKALQSAYGIASEGHDLAYYKKMLADFQEESARLEAEAQKKQEEAEAKAAEKAAAKAEKDAKAKEGKDKKKSRKSKAADDDDVDMEDAEAPKSTKKRKKDAESDAEGPKPKKTPKVTKLNAPKTPNGDSTPAKKASTAKPKKKVSAPKVEEESAEEKKELTEAERLDQREKAILYLRHRLQKGFLSRDQAPKEEEMSAMGEFFGQLEKYDNLEPSIIRTTKIHKVLKAIVKLASIPKDEELGFKKRSADLLEIWNKRMEGEGETAPKPAVEEKAPETNGETAAVPAASEEPAGGEAAEGAENVEETAEKKADEVEAKVEEKTDEPAEEKSEAKSEDKADESTEKPTEEPKTEAADVPAEKEQSASADKDEAVDGDVSMMTAPEEQS